MARSIQVWRHVASATREPPMRLKTLRGLIFRNLHRVELVDTPQFAHGRIVFKKSMRTDAGRFLQS